jgi:hypothetical protein
VNISPLFNLFTIEEKQGHVLADVQLDEDKTMDLLSKGFSGGKNNDDK